MSKKKGGKKKEGESPLLSKHWSVEQFYEMAKDPTVIFVDLRGAGDFRGGAPNSGVAETYHQGHFRLALNLNTTNITNLDELHEEIENGMNSAGGSIKEPLFLAIVSNFHFLLYNQDGNGVEFLDLFIQITITWEGNPFNIPHEYVHWLDGGYGALLSKTSTRKFCFDTKTLNGVQGEMEEPEFSQVLPYLFVGGSANSQHQFDELRDKGVKFVLNVSNIDANPGNFDYKFIFANDDQSEKITRLFYESADLIEEAIKEKKGVFVHCQRGLSRSPTLVMAYLMIKEHECLRNAFELVRRVRPTIGPRNNFMIELCLLERKLFSEGVHLSGYHSKFVYSLPIQLYALTSSNCGNYDDNAQFLFGKHKDRQEQCSLC